MWTKFGQLKGYGSKVKTSLKKTGTKIINKAKKYPVTTGVVGTIGAGYAYGKTEHARVTQNEILEMQKISLDRKTRSITKDEIKRRLEKAKQSKRKFTWI